MAALTWREVAAPNLGASLQGYEQFNSALQNALGQARQGLERVDNDISAEANNRIAIEALRQQDPAAMKAALESGTILGNVDPRRVNAQTIAMLSARPGQLLQQANQELALKGAQRTDTQTMANDALQADIALVDQQMRAGQPVDPEVLARVNAAQTQIGGANAAGLRRGMADAQMFNVDITGKRQDQSIARDQNSRAWNQDKREETQLGMAQERQSWNRTEFQWKGQDRKAMEQADAYLVGIRESVDPNNPETVRNAIFNGGLANASSKVKAAVYDRISTLYPGVFTPGEFGVAGGAGGSPLTAGGGSMRDYDAILSNEGGIDPKTGEFRRSSAGAWGPAQLMPGTAPDAMAAAGFRRSDQRWKTDPAINRQAGQAYYNMLKERYNGDPVKAAAAYNTGMGNFDKAVAKARAAGNAEQWYSFLPNETKKYVRDFQSKTGSGSTPAVMMGQQLRQGQDRQGRSSGNELLAAAGDTRTNPLDFVDDLKGLPKFKETSRGFLTSQLNSIVERSKNEQGNPTITMGQAAVILRDAARVNRPNSELISPSTWFNNNSILNWAQGNSSRINSAGDRISSQYIDQEIKRAQGGGVVQDAVREVDTAQRAARLQAAQQSASQAQAALQSAMMRQVTQPGLAGQIPLLRAKVAAANQQLKAVRDGTEQVDQPYTRPTATAAQGSTGAFFEIRREPGR